MTEQQVTEIAQRVYHKADELLFSIAPTLSTKQACEYLKCSRKWLYENRHLFEGKRVNIRGDYRFSTVKVVTYKRRKG